MVVESILAKRDVLEFTVRGAVGALLAVEKPAVAGRSAGRYGIYPIEHTALETYEMPRYEGKRDRALSMFTLWSDDGFDRAGGARFVTAFAPDAHVWDYEYPAAKSKKGTPAHGEDARALGVCHATYNINMLSLFRSLPGLDTFEYEFGGKTYFIDRETCAKNDEILRAYYEDGTNVSIICLNAARSFGVRNDPMLKAIAVHPDCDPDGFLSAFNVLEADGLSYYLAFLDFLAARYMREDARYGRATGLIVSNEIDLCWDWNNMGETTVDEMCEQYAVALRMAYLTAQRYWKYGRAYVSLAHFFNTSGDPTKPGRYFKGREVLEKLNAIAKRDGDFAWDVAYHPYAESWRNDFWNDRQADFTFDTPLITFKNVEVLPAFLAQPAFLCRGEKRRIIFSEQGFNAYDDLSNRYAFAGYCLAYKKIERIDVEAFVYHAYRDNPHEFGLSLGLRDGAGNAKPVWHAFQAMATSQEPEALEKARAIVGPEVWDNLLTPEVITARDVSHDREFC